MTRSSYRPRFRRRVVGPFVQAGCAGLSGRLTCVHGPSVPHERCEVMGPHPLQPRAFYELVANSQLSPDWDPAKRAAVIDHMASWGECLWHAVAIVRGQVDGCGCMACRPEDPRRAWRDLDLELARASDRAPHA